MVLILDNGKLEMPCRPDSWKRLFLSVYIFRAFKSTMWRFAGNVFKMFYCVEKYSCVKSSQTLKPCMINFELFVKGVFILFDVVQ